MTEPLPHILITGGTRGIGEAISVTLKNAGYTVAANYAGNDERAKSFTDRTGIKAFRWDVSSFDECVAGVKAVEASRYDMGQRIREVEQGPDGAIWLLEDGANARLLKLTPVLKQG